MTKNEFLSELKRALSSLSAEEAESYAQYYAEIIDDCMEDGASEAEAVASLGECKDLASGILVEAPPSVADNPHVKKQTRLSPFAWVLIILGVPVWGSLLIALVSVIISVYAVLWSVVVTAWALSASLLAVGAYFTLYSAFAFFISGAGTGMFSLGAGLLLIGVGLFAFLGCKYAAKGAVFISASIPKSIITLFKERK